MTDIARLKVDGIDGVVEVNLDPASWRGDVLETLEEHLGGESMFSWGRKWQAGKRLSEFRIRELIALVYLGQATADPDTTWEDISRAIAPFTIQFLDDDEPAPPADRRTTVHVDPNLGQQVPPPPLSPSLDALGFPSPPAEAPEIPELYRAT